MNNSTSTFKIIYDTFILIYSKKMTIILFVLSFTVLGFVNQHYIIITSGQEQKIITEITSNAIHSEIIISYLTSINEMDTYQKMMNLNLTKSEANSLKQIQCFRTPLPAANTDMILKKMVNVVENKKIDGRLFRTN